MFFMLLLSALIVGMSLGLLGAGGSILTVPALILLLGLDEKSAIASSLFIVASIAFIGALNAIKNGSLNLKVLGLFALSSLPASAVAAYIGVLLPAGLQTLLLTFVMLLAAIKMIRPGANNQVQVFKLNATIFAGVGAGFITGLVGVGGGFLIVPALVLFAGLSMQQAVANSLALIAINGSSAFIALQLSGQMPTLDWMIIAVMAGVGAIAVAIGQQLSGKLNQRFLKRCFAGLLMLVAAVMLVDILIF